MPVGTSPGVDYDIVIVGAGPAGLSTALHLAESNPGLARRCLVLEGKKHPREKLCAGGLTAGTLRSLRRLGADLDDVPRIPVTDVRLRLDGREVVLHGKPHCFEVVRRSVLDGELARLLSARGVSLEENTRALSAIASGDHVEVSTERGAVRCRVVVGADGASSIVRKSFWQEDSIEFVVGLQTITRQATDGVASEATLDFSPRTAGICGYLWDFPTHDSGRAVGIFAHGDSRKAADYLKSSLGHPDDSAENPLPVRAARTRAFQPSYSPCRPHALLVGDAAGVDPLFGEGIGFALGFGEVAALALDRAFADNDFSFADVHKQLLAHPVGRCLTRRHRFYRVLAAPGSPLLMKPLWNVVIYVGRRTLAMTTGEVTG